MDKKFCGLYSLQKTLRFELKPIGKTKENIEKNGILERDTRRAIGYKAVKKVIDEYHKDFIERMLNGFADYLRREDTEDKNKKKKKKIEVYNSLLHEYYSLYCLPTSIRI